MPMENELPLAISHLQQALDTIDNRLGNRQLAAGVHINLGFFYHEQGDFTQANEHYEAAIEILEALRSSADRGIVRLIQNTASAGVDLVGFKRDSCPEC